MTMMTIGILPQEKIRARLLAIAQGQRKPRLNDPKIWFTSMRSLAEVLSDENRALLTCEPAVSLPMAQRYFLF